MIRSLSIILCLLLLAASVSRAQGITTSERIPITAAQSAITLANDFVVAGSVRLILDSAYILQSPLDYTLDTRFGIVYFTPFFLRLLNDTSRPHALDATYNYRPIDLSREYYRRKLVTLVDSAGEKREIVQERTELTPSSIFGKDFQRSGSVVRGFTVGSNRDLSIQSGLRLQFSGKITDDVEVLGALTDEQTPIQPEGNTQTLREIDNIFIEFRSPYVGATVGKFTASSTTSEYTAFARKLQGVKASGRYGNLGTTEVVVAVSPGKFTTQLIQGQERNQGPYRLTGPAGERTIIVVAGTERVFVDGIEMVRGESNDYVIDYSTGEIFFQTRRPITSASRITVDFEYTDRQYSRSFISVANTARFFDNGLTLTANFLREADNPDATIDLTLNDQDRALLAAAGSDRLRAVRSGVYPRTDSVAGSYYRIDTLIDGRPDSIFVYTVSPDSALFNVIFTRAPDGRGDYRNIAFGRYEYVGRGFGEYLPVVYLPLPQLRQVMSLKVGSTPIAGVNISGEVAYSAASLNRFSLDPTAQQQGTAFSAVALARTDSLRVGGVDLGGLRFSGTARYLDARFQPIERLGDVEFANRWNTSARLGEARSNDFIAEGALTYLPLRRVEVTGSGGLLRRGDIFSSLRQLYSARLLGDTLLPSADYTFELISTTDSIFSRTRGRWMKQRGGVSYTIGAFTPGVRFEYEDREDRVSTSLTDTLYPSSFKYIEAGPELEITLPFMTTRARARYRIDDSVHYDPVTGGGRFLRDGTSQTYTLQGELRGIRDLTSTMQFTYRRKDYDSIPLVDQSRRLENVTILARSQTRWAGFDRGLDLDALYEVQTEQAARLQRIYLRVPRGQGEFIWIDRDSNGIQDDRDEYRPAFLGDGEYRQYDLPTEQLYPVIDLRTSLRLRLQPKRFVGDGTPLARILSALTSETYLRLEEKSQAERESDIYLLRLSRFQSDSSTLAGNSILQQDLHLFEASPEYSFRLRYLERRGLTRLYNAIERTASAERSLRARWQPTIDIGLQLDLMTNRNELRSSDSLSTRPFDLTTLSAENDFSYRPEQSLELGWKIKISSTEDVFPAVPRTTFLSTNEVRAVYSIETLGRLRAELERTTVSGENIGETALSLPYQLTDGYEIGTNWIGRLTFEYRFNANIQASVSYIGRAQPPSNRVIHTGQAELRAFF